MKFMELKNKSSTQKMVFVAIMSGLAVIINFMEIPYPPAPFLRFDLSEVIVIIVTLLLGLKFGLIVSIIKACVFLILGSNGSDIIGISVLLFSSCFLALIFSIFNKKLPLLFSLILTGIIFAITMTAVAYFVSVPLYSGTSFSELNQAGGYLKATLIVYLPFNLIKITVVSAVVLFVNRVLFKQKVY